MTTADVAWPAVSVVMPVRDEARHLDAAVRRVLGQDYPGEVELILAVAPSTDGTERVAERLVAADPRVRSVANRRGTTPAGLNAAIRAARHDVIARLDGHAIAPLGYLRTAVQVLRDTGAANVGGVMAAEGETPFEQAVACAMSSRLGLGGGAFHTGGRAGPADTVYLGVFRRDALERVGCYDEHFDRAQDWELNYRLRRAGETVWFTPALVVGYRPRGTVRALAMQQYRTGRWRRVVTRRYPDTVTARYLAPPTAVLGVAAGVALGLLGWPLGWLAPLGYGALLLVGTAVTGRRLSPAALAWLPLVLATIHLSWGAGFLASPRRVAAPTPARLAPVETL
jgi:hypothetical protein